MIDKGVDAHCHVFDTARFPFVPDAAYHPAPHESGTAAQFAAVLDAHGVSHAVLVNPTSGYGTDNRCMMAALRASNGRFRGIARVRPDTDDGTFTALHEAGVIGVRLDLVSDGVESLRHAAMPGLFARVRALGWHIQVQCERDQMHEAAPILRSAGVPLVVDHCGRPDATAPVSQPGFAALLALGREGHYVKLSGPFRFYRAFEPGARVEAFVAALLDAFTPQRCVWGSDWPFLRMPMRMDYGPVLANLARWIPDEAQRRQVLWETPARLYGFA
jgi:predicted TIM-barrel fold metal-dependent hydrolase